jgi:MFS superfamily sulfate permease-like transporter
LPRPQKSKVFCEAFNGYFYNYLTSFYISVGFRQSIFHIPILFMNPISNPLKNLGYDLPSSLVVFLVALPLCLGIALASGAPIFAGIIAGVVGGIVIGSLSGANLSVSGPAAGLTTIVISSIESLGSFDAFLCAVVLAGIFQVILGFLKAGAIGNFFPSAVIKGMLAAIGIILILKQIPHAFGYDRDFEGDESFTQADGENTFSEILQAWDYLTPGALLICFLSLLLIMFWESSRIKNHRFLRFIPAPLLVVALGILLNSLFVYAAPNLIIGSEHLVNIQVSGSAASFLSQLNLPDFSQLYNTNIYVVAITIAIVASLETLLSIEAGDKLDPFKRKTPLNRELKAQGIGNVVSGLLGGLPITSVIVRSSANIASGARTKASTISHGVLLLLAVSSIPSLLNLIPLASLASILILTGYKLAKPSIFKTMYRNGLSQFLPFVVTILAIIFTDLLIGIGIGLAVGLFFVLRSNFHEAISITEDKGNYLLRLNKDVSFLNKSLLRTYLDKVPNGATLIIDGGHSRFVDHDIIETIEDFMLNALNKDINVEIKKSFSASNDFFKKNKIE